MRRERQTFEEDRPAVRRTRPEYEEPATARPRSKRRKQKSTNDSLLYNPLFHLAIIFGIGVLGYLAFTQLGIGKFFASIGQAISRAGDATIAPEPESIIPDTWKSVVVVRHLKELKGRASFNPLVQLASKLPMADNSDNVYVVTFGNNQILVICRFLEPVSKVKFAGLRKPFETYRDVKIYQTNGEYSALFGGLVGVATNKQDILHQVIDCYHQPPAQTPIPATADSDLMVISRAPILAGDASIAMLIPQGTNYDDIDELKIETKLGAGTGREDYLWTMRSEDAARDLANRFNFQNKAAAAAIDRLALQGQVDPNSGGFATTKASYLNEVEPTGNQLQFRLEYDNSILEKVSALVSSPGWSPPNRPGMPGPSRAPAAVTYGPERRVKIHLTSVPPRAHRRSIKQWFQRYDGENHPLCTMQVEGEDLTLELAPVDDIEVLAERIEFGDAVVDTENRTIEVAVTDPASLPRPPRRPRPAPPHRPPNRLAPSDEKTVKDVVAALTSEKSRNKREAIEYLQRHEPLPTMQTKVASILDKTLKEDPAAWDWDPVARAFMVWMTPAELPTLIRLTEHRDVFLRNDAILRLADFDDERGYAALVRLLATDRGRAEDALKLAGPSAESVVIDVLHNGNLEEQKAACRILAVIGSAEAIPALEEKLDSADFGLKVDAEHALEVIE